MNERESERERNRKGRKDDREKDRVREKQREWMSKKESVWKRERGGVREKSLKWLFHEVNKNHITLLHYGNTDRHTDSTVRAGGDKHLYKPNF